MNTHRLYYENAYLTEFDATVVAARADHWIALDRSAFYPTSGGQPYDTGVLTAGEKAVRVTDVQAEDGVVWHRTDGGTFDVGEAVHGRIDWERRWDHMQQHAADHMLAGAAWQLYGGVTIGLHLGKEDSTIDLTLPDGRTRWTEEEKEKLETLVNQRVQRDDPIRCWFPEEKELAALPLRKKPTVTEHVRVVAMGDYEMVACGGTHPRSTGQIGPVKILCCTPARGKMRLCFLAGMRAVRYFQRTARCAQETAAALSSDVEGAPQALLREREEHLETRRELDRRLVQAAVQAIRGQGRGPVYAAHLEFAAPDTLVHAAAEITRDPEAVALLSCPGKERRTLVFCRGAAVRADMADLLRRCGARGGGKADMARGSDAEGGALERARELIQTIESKNEIP